MANELSDVEVSCLVAAEANLWKGGRDRKLGQSPVFNIAVIDLVSLKSGVDVTLDRCQGAGLPLNAT